MHARQEVARLLADALRVREMTRILVRRAKIETPQSFAGDVGEVLAHVAHLGRERDRAFAPRDVVREQDAVALELRAAAGGVDDDRVDVRLVERGDVAARQRSSVLALAGMRVQRAAARLCRRVDDRNALSRQDAGSRGVHIAVRDAHDAAEQERDARSRSGRWCRRAVPRSTERWIERRPSR